MNNKIINNKIIKKYTYIIKISEITCVKFHFSYINNY